MIRRVALVVAIVASGVVTAEAASAMGATTLGNLYGRVRTELTGGWRYIVDVPETYIHDSWIAYRADNGGELGCNFVRLAHYPHSEKMTRLADRLGLLVWSEVPVYWAIAYSNEHTRDVAVRMVTENVLRGWYATIKASHAAGGS